MTPIRICILGAGGLGTVLAGFLSRAGVEVTLLVRPVHAAAYEAARVVISGPVAFEAPVRIASNADGLGPFDYLVVCVKGRDTEAALDLYGATKCAAALSLQNGVSKDEPLRRRFGAARVIGAATMCGGELQRPGYSRLMSPGATLLGELDGGTSARTERLARAIDSAGLPAAAVPQIVTREWQKLVTFLPGALVCALTDTDMAGSLLDADLAHTRLRLSREIAAVASAEGQPLGSLPVFLNAAAVRPEMGPALPGFDCADAEILAAYAAQGYALRAQGAIVHPSLQQDLAAGRPTELEETAGDVLRRAAGHGIAMPALQSCAELIRGIDRRHRAEPAVTL